MVADATNYSFLSDSLISPMIVDAILRVSDDTNVDMKNIKIVKKLGGTIEDTELVQGVVLDKRFAHTAGGAERVEKAKIALIQFCLSPPKTDVRCSFFFFILYYFFFCCYFSHPSVT